MRVSDPIDMRGAAGSHTLHQPSMFLENNLRACVEGQGVEIADSSLAARRGLWMLLPGGQEHWPLSSAWARPARVSPVYQNGCVVEASVHNWGSGLIISDVAADLKCFEEATELVVDYGINLQMQEDRNGKVP